MSKPSGAPDATRRAVGVEADRGAGALGDGAGEGVVDDLGADDGADRLALRLVLDGAGDDAVDAALPDPGVVADPAVERVGDAGVAAELPVLVVLEADAGDDAAVGVDGPERVELEVGGHVAGELAERAA